MNNASLELGGTNWAEKDGNILGYSVANTSGNFYPQEFTFARGSNLSATRIGKTGLIEKGRENLLLQSNQFDTTWATGNASVTSGQSGYDGSNDAWLLDASVSFGSTQQSISFSGLCTISLYVKKGSADGIRIRLDAASDKDLYIDLVSNSIFQQDGISANIQSISNGWHRIEMASNITSLNRVVLYPSNGATIPTTGSIYIQDSQLELGLAASPYIETTTTSAQAGVLENTPRLNYTTGVANPYLLLEPSRTNRLANSENGYGWTTSNVTVLPFDGGINGKYFQLTSNSSASRFNVIENPWVNLAAATYTASVFAKKGTTDEIILTSRANYATLDKYASFNLTSGTIITTSTVTANIEEYSDGWYKCSITFTNAGSYSDFASFAYGFNYNASSTDTLFVTAPQSEIGTYPTSYIPTYSVSATRAADACYKLNTSGEIGQTEGTMFIDFEYQSTDAGNRFSISDNSALNWIFIGTPESGNSSRFYIRVNNTVIVDVGASSYFVDGQRYKLALTYKSGDWAVYSNGTQLYSGSETIPAFTNPLDTVNFKSYISTNAVTDREKINQMSLFKERLTNAELATLTTI